MIVCYLHGTSKMVIVKQTGSFEVVNWCDCNFCGLHRHDPDESPSSVKSLGGFILTLSEVPFVWKSQLQSEIALSTMKAEYSLLSSRLWTLLPL